MRVLVSAAHFFDETTAYPEFTFVTNDPEIWICDPHVKITKHYLLEMPSLKLIVTPSTGVTHLDMDLLEQYGIEVLSLRDNPQELQTITASSEFAFLMILATLRNYHIGLWGVAAGNWHNKDTNLIRGNELAGKTVGLVGYGRIGRNLAEYLECFGADSFAYDPYVKRQNFVDLEMIFKECDIVVICCTLTPESTRMVTKDMLLSMKENACLVNVARGEILDELGVYEALKKRPDIRLSVDVLAGEHNLNLRSHPFMSLKRQVAITPHMAGTTYESEDKAARIALDLARAWHGRRQQLHQE